MMLYKPCLSCNKRQPGCHSACEEYKTYRTELDALNQTEKQFKDGYHRERGSWAGTTRKLRGK